MKPECPRPECGGKHAAEAHELLGGVGASVNLIAGGDHESEEDEEWYVNIIRVEQEGEDQKEFNDSWLELDGEESEEEAGVYCPSACMRKDNSGLEEELEYFHVVTPPPDAEGVEEDRWWSPELQRPESEEEDEEENQCLVSLLLGESKKENNSEATAQPQNKTEASLHSEYCQAPEGEPGRKGEGPRSGGPLIKKKPRRRELRKSKAVDQHGKWETARHEA